MRARTLTRVPPMNAPGEAPSVHQQALDWLFARLGGQAGADPAPPAAEPWADAPPAEAEPAPAPEVHSPEDLKLASAWLQRERARLETYTRSQLARIQREHQAQVAQNYLNEQTLILRSQELTRKEELFVSRGRALQTQAQELAQREQALAGQLQQW